jgi:hypothetical protein
MRLFPNDWKLTLLLSVIIVASWRSCVWLTGSTKSKEWLYFLNEILWRNRMSKCSTFWTKTKIVMTLIVVFFSDSWRWTKIYGLTSRVHNLFLREDLRTKKSREELWNIHKIRWLEGRLNPWSIFRRQLKDKVKFFSSSIKIRLIRSGYK